jgi:ferrous iron transport protein B
MKILLMGNPNVGKSALFARLTGVHVVVSNYPGTTVEYTTGWLTIGDEKAKLIDVPGAYTLNPTNRAELVAVEMLKQGDVVINVVNATNLERNLYLSLQLVERGIPMVVALNMWDEALHTGIAIDVDRLEALLGIPVVPTVAVSGEGVKHLVTRISEAKPRESIERNDDERWKDVGRIATEVSTITHRHHSILDKLADLSVQSWSGLPMALVVLLACFFVVRLIGEGLIRFLFEPVFTRLWAPLMMRLSVLLGSEGIVHDILVGKLVEGEIDFVESLGVLTTGLFVPLAMVLPYVVAFYFILSLLEDSGYLPRLAVLVDGLMHRVGLHGLAIVPMLLGLGCNVPGALATRVLETRRERFIGATLMAICVPCMAQLAMIVGLLGTRGARGIAVVFATLVVVWVALGALLNRFIRGESPAIFVEIPPYRLPYWKSFSKKLWMRVHGFVHEAVPFVLAGVLLVNLLYVFGVIDLLGRWGAGLVNRWLGLPTTAVGALVVGFLRKDVAVGMLIPLGLSLRQLVVASVILAMYFPCVATFVVLIRELGWRDMLVSAILMILSALIVGGVLNLILAMVGW